MMLLSDFSRRRMNGAVTLRSSSVASRSPLALDGHGEALAEAPSAAEEARVEDVHQGPQLRQPVLDGRAGQGDASARVHGSHRAGLRRARVLHLLRLVEHQASPRHRRPAARDPGRPGSTW